MRWYRIASLESINDAINPLARELANLSWLGDDMIPEERNRKKEIEKTLSSLEVQRDDLSRKRKERIERYKGKPHLLSPEEFLEYHKTGNISQEAYRNYGTLKGISWLGTPDKYPILIKSMQHGGENIEYRQSGKTIHYVKHEGDDIARGPDGMALYLSPEEVRQKELPETDTTIVAFNEKGQPVGWASNEFGTDGVFVADPYQKMGIGIELLDLFRRQFPPERRMGQMTGAGQELARAYHRRLVERAGSRP